MKWPSPWAAMVLPFSFLVENVRGYERTRSQKIDYPRRCPFVNQHRYSRLTRNGLPIQPSNSVIPKRLKALFKVTAELILLAGVVGVLLVGVGVEEELVPEGFCVVVKGVRHLALPAASR